MSGDLYHFTCEHGYLALGQGGDLKPPCMFAPEIPHMRKIPTARFVWLTDLTLPLREPLGLTSWYSPCDRTKYRYRAVDLSDVYPWVVIRREVPRVWREALEESYGARPSHWYVSTSPVSAVLDQGPGR